MEQAAQNISFHCGSSTDEERDSNSHTRWGIRKLRQHQQFSVLRSEENGLRMKISAVRNLNDSNSSYKAASVNNNNSIQIRKEGTMCSPVKKRQRRISSSTSSSYCSMCSRSGSECNTENLVSGKVRKTKMKRKRACTTRLENRKEENTSTDSEYERENVKNVSVRNEDQKFVSHGDIIHGSCPSSSDDEIPELINAAIKCVENYTEIEHPSLQSSKQYTSTLLHDFMIKTQMVGNSTATENNFSNEENLKIGAAKRRRGRPRKNSIKDSDQITFSLKSAIHNKKSRSQSLSDSMNNYDTQGMTKNINEKNEKHLRKDSLYRKINVVSLDKQTYPIERVLYPPRMKQKLIAKPNAQLLSTNEDSLDPLWRKIDVNLKFRRPSLSGYKSDGGVTVCSKILAARSGYISDYSSMGNRIYSGYKSDASSKSRFSLSSYISRAKSCSYKAGHLNKKYKYFKRRDSSFLRSSKSIENVAEQDILQLAGLSLGQSSEESSKESNFTSPIKSVYAEKRHEINKYDRTNEIYKNNEKAYGTNNLTKDVVKLRSECLNNLNYSLPKKQSFSYIYQNYLKRTKSRLSSTLSQCTTLTAVSKVQLEKRRKAKLKGIKYVHVTDPKLNAEIEILTDNLSTLHLLGIDKSIHTRSKEKQEKEKNGSKLHGKKIVKKKRNLQNAEHHVLPNIATKRRHKRTNHSNQDEHKLPLKKRHYLLTPGERSSIHIQDYKRKDTALDLKPVLSKSTLNNYTKIFSKAITPKKRHLLECSLPSESNIDLISKSISSSVCDLKTTMSGLDGKEMEGQKYFFPSKTEKEIQKRSDIMGILTPKLNSINNVNELSKVPGKTTTFFTSNLLQPSIEINTELSTKLHSNQKVKSEISLPVIAGSTVLENHFSKTKFHISEGDYLNKISNNVLSKRKRRKAFNRTGFPTVKKKKRKISELNNYPSEKKNIDLILGSKVNVNELYIEEFNCDRVPRLGETSDTFLERHGKPRLSVVSLEKLQTPVRNYRSANYTTNTESVCGKSAIEDSVNIPNDHTNNLSKSEIDSVSKIICSKKLFDRELRYKKKIYCHYENNKETHTYSDSTVNENVSTPQPNAAISNNYSKAKVISLASKNSRRKIKETKFPTRANKSQYKAEITIDNCPFEVLEQDPLPATPGLRDLCKFPGQTRIKKGKTKKWKKIFLVAGLFSNFYKMNKRKKYITSNDITFNENESSLLPSPPYCEKFFRRTIHDFLLPYDIWIAYQNSKFKKRIIVPSWNYKKIRANIYGDVRPNPVVDHQACNCNPQSACGDDCLNRMVYTECSPSNCPCGDKCQNQKVQRHEIAPGIERFMTENKGWGVRTNFPIKKGTYILEYVGEVVTENEFKERMATLYANDTHHYCLHLDGGLVIDGHRMGSDGRFVNHSCSPNCEMQKWSVNGLFRMALFALRDIQAGEELTYDYNFSLFNPSEGQPCRCDTPLCRGVIGGKSQRLKPVELKQVESQCRNSRTRKRQAKKVINRFQSKDSLISSNQQLSDREKRIVRGKRCFLVRNLEKTKKFKIKKNLKVYEVSNCPKNPLLVNQVSPLRTKNIKFKSLIEIEHDGEAERVANMSLIFRELYATLENVKDSQDVSHIAKLVQMFKQQDLSEEHNIKNIDLSTIQTNIENGLYTDPNMFDDDINRIFSQALICFATNSDVKKIIEKLSVVYLKKKKEVYSKLLKLMPNKKLSNFLSSQLPSSIAKMKKSEDIIQCICGLFKDEGLMIQCFKCLIWQHTECTKANINAEKYLCERCEPRSVDLEIPLDEYTDEGYRYYLSLLRGNLQIRQSDTVYVLRDIPIKDEFGEPCKTKKHNYETIGKVDYSECDIFRIERLWKDSNGKRFIYGHHYLRPHETFHEPTRKFYENEVIRVPLYEVVPIELIIARCWVLDRATFCKGRPKDCLFEKHVYICELRVDKSARFFSKAKQPYPICTKAYAFEHFPEKLKISRTYAPHDLSTSIGNSKKKRKNDSRNQRKKNISFATPTSLLTKVGKWKHKRLECVLNRIKRKQCPKFKSSPIDLSYLFTVRGARQKRTFAANVPL